MATELAPGALTADELGTGTSVNFVPFTFGAPDEGMFGASDPLLSDSITEFTGSLGVASVTGELAGRYLDDWYFRVHVIPRGYDLGNLLQSESRNVLVWNANFAVVDLDDISATGDEGISIVAGPLAPHTYEPLEERTYTFQFGLDGPAQIRAEYLFEFDNGQSFTLLFTGTRAVIFAFEPQLPITEELEWVTDVLEARDGTEQRVRVRKDPRQRMTMTYLLADREQLQFALHTLFGQAGRSFAVPTWWDFRPLLADVSVGATSIPIDPTSADFRAPGFAILWRSPQDFEVVEINSIGAASLELLRPTEKAHPALGTSVMPIQTCFARPEISTPRRGNNVTTIEATWEATGWRDRASDGSFETYKSLPVVVGTNFLASEELDESLFARQDRLDSIAGAFRVARRAFPLLRSQRRWEPESVEEVWALRQILHALRGRQRAFWLPTFREDFELLATISGASTALTVRNSEYERFLGAQAPWADIEIVLHNGTTYRREIVSSQTDAPNEQLNIDTPLGVSVTVAEVKRISYLLKMRLDTDTVQLTHRGLGRAEASVPTVVVTG
jgi:hypothetical protein